MMPMYDLNFVLFLKCCFSSCPKVSNRLPVIENSHCGHPIHHKMTIVDEKDNSLLRQWLTQQPAKNITPTDHEVL